MADVTSDEAVRVNRGAEVLAAIPLFNAILRTGISPTMLAAGTAHNVIPMEATATMSVRTLPSESIDQVIATLRTLVGDSAIGIEVVSTGIDARASSSASPMYAAISRALAGLDPKL